MKTFTPWMITLWIGYCIFIQHCNPFEPILIIISILCKMGEWVNDYGKYVGAISFIAVVVIIILACSWDSITPDYVYIAYTSGGSKKFKDEDGLIQYVMEQEKNGKIITEIVREDRYGNTDEVEVNLNQTG